MIHKKVNKRTSKQINKETNSNEKAKRNKTYDLALHNPKCFILFS